MIKKQKIHTLYHHVLEKCINYYKISKKDLKSTTVAILIVGIPILMGVSLIAYSQGYFEVLTSEPKMSLNNVSYKSSDITCIVDFNIENSGNADGYAVIELRFGPAKNLIEQNRYFVKANSMVEEQLSTKELPAQYCSGLQNILSIARTEQE